MARYVVTYTHPDEDGWVKHVGPHVDWLVAEVEAGRLIASGPLLGTPVRSAMLIVDAEDRAGLDAMIASDPFSVQGLIAELSVVEWDPIFGALAPRPAEEDS